MELETIRQKFLDHFNDKGYKVYPSSSVIPENDPSVLFTTAGMQQFKNYYSHPDDAPFPQLSTVQPVIRTSDIAEVGDETHLTMFEMLGIFSFGQKDPVELKKHAIESMWQFVHEVLNVDQSRVYATIFAGDEKSPRDSESEAFWKNLGVETKEMGREDNFWGPTGDEGPCGPNSEIFIDDVEVGNLVFNLYYQDTEGNLSNQVNVGLDFGSGLERLTATLQAKQSVWEIEPFKSWINSENTPTMRTIVDHLRAAIFLINAGVEPANKGRSYVLRRLIRKAAFLAKNPAVSLSDGAIISAIRDYYASTYQLIDSQKITEVINKEIDQFTKNLDRATSYLQKWLNQNTESDEKQITELAFYMYESFGFPKELVIEHLASLGRNVDVEHFEKLFAQHQEVSRAGLEAQFKGGLADHEPQTVKHHTAHHLLLAALQQVLGPSVVQRGSNVTSERLRMDFAFDRKLTEEELKQAEVIVNQKIAENLPVIKQEMPKEEALQSGAQAEFGQKYGDVVCVYSIGDFSKELCGGPHVAHTGDLGRFEILKEEASSQGVRRIKARLV